MRYVTLKESTSPQPHTSLPSLVHYVDNAIKNI